MLSLRKLVVEDFGPYKGAQEFPFPAGAGVTVVYGENRRGKTSLLNAIRYALLGVVVTRGSRQIDFDKVVNREARDEGRNGFRVTIDFEFNGQPYTLVRRCEPLPGVVDPSRNEDYSHSVYLKRANQPLSQVQTAQELGRIMPPEIARFFLFDGELLAEYEELLRDKGENDVGARISAAIEQILGLPVLQHAREDLGRLAEEAAQQESRAAQKDVKTQRIGALLENLDAELQLHRAEHARLQADLTASQGQKTALEDVLAKSARLDTLLTERARLETEIAEYEQRIADKQVKLQTAMATAWRGMIAERLLPLRQQLETRRDDLQRRVAVHLVAAHRAQELRDALATGRCPVCESVVEPGALQANADGAHVNGAVDLAAEQMEALRIQQQLETVARIAAGDNVHAADLFDDIEAAKTAMHGRCIRKDELLDEIADYNEEDFRTQRRQYEATIKRITILQNGVDAQAAQIQRTEAGMRDARSQLDKLGGAGLAGERHKREMYEALSGLFRDAVATYRERLRSRVQEDATDLFLKLTSEPEDAGLRINDQYGLTIVHKDGTDIAVRSSGAEHIVALSLMGALQRNAPLRGPLIMDSLLIRIDDTHRENVVRALPTMAEQVVLLVFGAELRPAAARERLEGSLLAEYELNRVSSRHTEIQPLRA